MALIFVHEGYNTGLFDCHDDHQSCFSTMFCAPCAVRAQFQILKDQPSGKFRWICLPFQFVGFVVYGVFMPLWSAITRDMVRRKFHLAQESMLVSAAKGFFCAPCSVGQVYREMSLRHMWPADGSLCVDAPYTKAGLVVPPPNPDRMGGTWASSRAGTTIIRRCGGVPHNFSGINTTVVTKAEKNNPPSLHLPVRVLPL